MDFIDACKVVLRRWYLAVPLLLLTFAGTSFAYATASSDYSAKGALILIQPAARVAKEGEPAIVCSTNPWCPSGDVLSLANVTTRTMDDPQVQNQLLDPHPGASYQVVLNADNRSAIMELTAVARKPKVARETLRDLSARVEKELNQRQVGGATPVDFRDLVTMQQVTMANRAVPQSGGKLRAAAGAFGLGIAVTLGGTFLAESIAVSRRARASLLDRIALPDQPMSSPPARRSGAPEPDDATVARGGQPKPVSAGPRRSGRVGS